jgi:heavy metal sensor kinase
LSIRWRLTLWYGLALALTFGLLCAAIYARSRAALDESADADLLKDLKVFQSELAEEIEEDKASSLRDSHGTRPAQTPEDVLRRASNSAFSELRLAGISAEIRYGSRAEILLGRSLAKEHDTVAVEALARARAGARAGIPGPVLPGYRSVFQNTPTIAGYGPLTFVLVEDTEMFDQSLRAIRKSLVGLSVLGVLLAIGGGYILAFRALRPIDSLGKQAAQLLEARAVSAHRLEAANEDDELGRLANVFNQLLERLDAALAQMKRFVEDAAHELRTPVSLVRGEAELALSKDRSAGEYRDALKAIAGEGSHLSRLVRDLTLLSHAQVDESPIEGRLVDLGEIVDETIRALRCPAEARRIRIDVNGSYGVQCVGDEHLIREILSNLIENAIKFSPESSSARVEVHAGDSSTEIRVADQAPTIAESERERVFERFYRGAAARSGEIDGSGLGLAIVRSAAERHGGSVRIEPAFPSGNVFIVSLPARIA